MSNSSNKQTSNESTHEARLKASVDFTLLTSNLFIVYISGLLVIMGALVMSPFLQFNSLEQATLVSLILGGLFAVASAVHAIQLSNKLNDKEKLVRLLLTGILSLLAWVSVAVSTVLLIVSIALA